MRRLEAHVIERFNETEVDTPKKFEVEVGGRPVPYDAVVGNTPIVTTSYDALTNPQLVLGTEGELPFWDEEQFYPVGRLDRIHGRTLEVLSDDTYVEDKYGNEYGCLNIKGCDLSNPHFFTTRTAARGHIIYGLQESIVMERVLRASKVLRENNVGTEYICGLVSPANYPLDRDRQLVDQKECVELPELLEHSATRFASEQNKNGKTPLEVKADMLELFRDCDYLITYRAMDCPYRAGELSSKEKYRDFKQYMAKHIEGGEIGDFVKGLDSEVYLKTVLSYSLSKNVAKMHKAGLYHGFLVKLNVSAMGSVIDLDSCRGETLGLGDEPITTKDEVSDVIECLQTLREIVGEMDLDAGSRPETEIYKLTTIHTATQVFLKYYLKERFSSKKERIEFLESILLYSGSVKDEKDAQFGNYTSRLAEEVIDVYRKMCTPDYEGYLGLVEEGVQGKKIGLRSSFLKTVPPKYFKDKKDRLINDDWTMNESLRAEFQTKKKIYPPVRFLLKDILFEELYSEAKESDSEQIKNYGQYLLFLSGCSLDRLKPRLPNRVAAVNEATDHMQNRTAEIINRFASGEGRGSLGKYASSLADKVDFDVEELTGCIDITEEDHPLIDVIYAENDDQYEALISALNINENTLITQFSEEVYFDLASRYRALKPDSLIIADYKVAEWVAEQTTQRRVGGVLLAPRINAKPLIIVTDLESGKPEVFVHPVPHFADKDYNSLNELLSAVAPSKYAAHSLF